MNAHCNFVATIELIFISSVMMVIKLLEMVAQLFAFLKSVRTGMWISWRNVMTEICKMEMDVMRNVN